MKRGAEGHLGDFLLVTQLLGSPVHPPTSGSEASIESIFSRDSMDAPFAHLTAPKWNEHKYYTEVTCIVPNGRIPTQGGQTGRRTVRREARSAEFPSVDLYYVVGISPTHKKKDTYGH
jgi:hypothetical protein